MVDFRSLEPTVRTYALVGRFLDRWALLETALSGAIAAALNVNNIAKYILAANIGFRNKTYILRALCSISYLDDRDKEIAENMINVVANLYGHRNIIAHETFVPSTKTDGVEFLVLKARGKFSAPEADWSVEHFDNLDASLIAHATGLDSLTKKLNQARKIPANSLAAIIALSSAILPPPSEEALELGSLGLLFPHPPTDHTSATTAASPETETETAPSERE